MLGNKRKPNLDRIGTKLLAGNIVILTVLLLIVAGSGVNFYRTERSLSDINEVFLPQITLADTIKETVLKQHVTVQSYISHPSLEVKNSYRQLDRDFEADYRRFGQLAVSLADKQLIDQVKNEHDNFTMIANNIFNYTDKGRSQLVKTLLDNYSVSVDRVLSSSDQLAGRFATELNKSVDSTTNNLNLALTIMVILTVLAFGGALVMTLLLTRKITSPMQQMIAASQDIARGDLRQRVSLADQGELGLMATAFNSMVENLSSLIQEVISASQFIVRISEGFRKYANDSAQASNTADSVLRALVDSSSHQSRNITSVLRSADNVAQAIQQINEAILRVNKHNSQTTHLAEEGKRSVEEGFHQMELIRRTMGYLAGAVGELTSNLGEISRIIDMMENFAEQTNMLALNAAIEAARVGEQGKGFAVVANEVRQLADESSKSLEQIRAMINKIQAKSAETAETMEESKVVVETGARAMQSLGAALKDIVSFVNDSVSQFRELVGVSSDISNHSRLIVRDMKDLESVARETVDHSETLAMVINCQTQAIIDAAASLGEIAAALEQSTGKFALSSFTGRGEE